MAHLGVETPERAAALAIDSTPKMPVKVTDSHPLNDDSAVRPNAGVTDSNNSRALRRFGKAGFFFFLIKGIFWMVAGIAAVSAGGSLF